MVVNGARGDQQYNAAARGRDGPSRCTKIPNDIKTIQTPVRDPERIAYGSLTYWNGGFSELRNLSLISERSLMLSLSLLCYCLIKAYTATKKCQGLLGARKYFGHRTTT